MNNNEFSSFVSNYNSKTTHSRQFVSSISSFLIAICIEKQLNERKSFLIILFFLSSTWQFRWKNYFFSIPHSTWCRSSSQHHINLTREQTVSWWSMSAFSQRARKEQINLVRCWHFCDEKSFAWDEWENFLNKIVSENLVNDTATDEEKTWKFAINQQKVLAWLRKFSLRQSWAQADG